MRPCTSILPILCVLLSGVLGVAQDKSQPPTNQIQLRLAGSSVHKEAKTVSLASALLKRQITKHADGGGTLSGVLLLTNHPDFNCQSDPDMPLASEGEFVIGIALYEAFGPGEGLEKTILHQMLFSAPKATDPHQAVTLQWKGDAAVLFRLGPGKTQWQSLKKVREENALTITEEGGKAVLSLDYSDQATEVKGRVTPLRCP